MGQGESEAAWPARSPARRSARRGWGRGAEPSSDASCVSLPRGVVRRTGRDGPAGVAWRGRLCRSNRRVSYRLGALAGAAELRAARPPPELRAPPAAPRPRPRHGSAQHRGSARTAMPLPLPLPGWSGRSTPSAPSPSRPRAKAAPRLAGRAGWAGRRGARSGARLAVPLCPAPGGMFVERSEPASHATPATPRAFCPGFGLGCGPGCAVRLRRGPRPAGRAPVLPSPPRPAKPHLARPLPFRLRWRPLAPLSPSLPSLVRSLPSSLRFCRCA